MPVLEGKSRIHCNKNDAAVFLAYVDDLGFIDSNRLEFMIYEHTGRFLKITTNNDRIDIVASVFANMIWADDRNDLSAAIRIATQYAIDEKLDVSEMVSSLWEWTHSDHAALIEEWRAKL